MPRREQTNEEVIRRANIFAAKKNGACIKVLPRKKYKGRLMVLCKCNVCKDDPFVIRFQHLKNGHWHIQCLGREKINFKTVQKTAKKKGGKFIKFIKLKKNESKTNIKGIFECIEGHRWKTVISNVRAGTWCKICSDSISERICRVVFETLFQKKFPKSYPEFLLNKSTNRYQELDGLCSKLNLAFEYQGYFHSKKSEKLTKNKELYKKVSLYEQRKRRLCKLNGIKLIEIPDFKNENNKIPNFIIKKISKQKINFKKVNIKKIDINKAYLQRPILEFKRYIGRYDFKLKHNVWKGSYPAYEAICPYGHNFERTISKFRKLKPSKWCLDCNHTKKYSNRYTTKKIKEILKKYKIKIISKNYSYNQDVLKEIKLKCDKGHIFEKNLKIILTSIRKNKKICRICSGNKVNIEMMQELAKKLGAICLSKEYLNSKTNLNFKCKRNHMFKRKRYELVQFGLWCKKCKKTDGKYPNIPIKSFHPKKLN